MGADFWIVIKWWGTLFLVGAVAFPLTKKLFPTWYDRGYFFAKAVGLVLVTYIVYFFGMYHILPFIPETIWLAMGIVFAAGMWMNTWNTEYGIRNREHTSRAHQYSVFNIQEKKELVRKIILVGMEELFFLIALVFWSWVKGHEASIHGLEKFMDFGFMQSIYNSAYFPAPDMWYAGYPINYYYFGHTVVALLSKLSGVSLIYGFNLMLATIFAFCFTMSFSIGVQLYRVSCIVYHEKIYSIHNTIYTILSGILTAFLVTLAGNMQTLYAFTKGYTGENVKPFWSLAWTIGDIGGIGGIGNGMLLAKLTEGLERYWYANATRFIPFTIHEFPSYSFVVSDVHGHVMSIPFVLLAIALLIEMFVSTKHEIRNTKQIQNQEIINSDGLSNFEFRISKLYSFVFYGLLVAVLLMTNALDGPIYLGLFIVLFIVFNWSNLANWLNWIQVGLVVTTAILVSIPFMSKFSSFVTGLALNCPPAFLANRKIGPLLFEGIEKCQHSPFWMVWLLWGFFIYCGTTLVFRVWYMVYRKKQKVAEIPAHELLLIVFFFISIALIIFPEFFYFKDIYPAHFRSNTMFKLGYQAFIMFSIVSAYAIISFISKSQENIRKKFSIFNFQFSNSRTVFLLLLIPQLFLVSIYPIFSVRSYFDSLRTYKGLDGLAWLAESYPDDYAGIVWLREHGERGKGKGESVPVIVEADGDSYTDHARFSAFTGLPAIMGWPVHEWLWRGSYDVVAPRREEVRIIYESEDRDKTRSILQKYGVEYIIVGGMERTKFTSIALDKLNQLATVVFRQGELSIYRTNK